MTTLKVHLQVQLALAGRFDRASGETMLAGRGSDPFLRQRAGRGAMELEFRDSKSVVATAWLLGERIDVRAAPPERVISRAPLTLRGDDEGLIMLYRFGAAVVFDFGGARDASYPERIRPLVVRPFDDPESDDAQIRIVPDEPGGVDSDAAVVLPAATLDRLQVVADVLARSALLAHYEARLASSLDRMEPLAERLRHEGRAGLRARRLLAEIGDALVTEMHTVGRAEVSEKPGHLWDRPDLDRLYVRLAEEYELEDRDRAVARKLELLGRSAGTLLEVLQTRRTLNVEWYIVILILLEIVILIYDLGTR
jgi:uncharacterized Rmd1/YagE family protein